MYEKLIKAAPFFLTLLCVGFIWLHSMMNGVESAEESMSVLGFITQIFEGMGLDVDLTEHILRKLAHFSEFALLGILLAIDTLIAAGSCIKNIGNPLFLSIFVAAVDETIQLYSEGRSSSVIDIWIDFAGAAAGIAIFVLIFELWYKRHKQNKIISA